MTKLILPAIVFCYLIVSVTSSHVALNDSPQPKQTIDDLDFKFLGLLRSKAISMIETLKKKMNQNMKQNNRCVWKIRSKPHVILNGVKNERTYMFRPIKNC